MSSFVFVFSSKQQSLERNLKKSIVKSIQEDPFESFNEFESNQVYIGCTKKNINRNNAKSNIFFHKYSNILVVMNGRIDNRSEIYEALSIKNNVYLSDEEIIFLAFKKWGINLSNKIIGSFAFLIFDITHSLVHVSKDHIGSKSLHYYSDNTHLIIATNIRSITKNINTLQLNKKRIRQYIVNLHGEENETFFKDVMSIPKSTIKSFDLKSLSSKSSKYFDFNPYVISEFADIDECAEAFLEIFTLVIKQQSQGLEKIGSKLSGGLDSSSITSLLAKINNAKQIETFSAVFRGLDEKDYQKTDETYFMNSVLKMYNLQPNFVEMDKDKIDPFLYANDSKFDEVTPHANRYFECKLLEAASKRGINVLFDGFDGDSVLTHGYEYLYDLSRKKNFKALFNNARFLYPDISNFKILKNYILKPLIPMDIKWLIQRFFKTNRLQDRYLILNAASRKKSVFISPKDISNNYKQIDKTTYVQEMHYKTLNWPVWQVALNYAEIDSRKFGVEERYPFFDRRVMEFCLSVPGRFRSNKNVTRYYMRESMKGILPKENINRLSKADISPLFVNALTKKGNILKEIDSEIMREYVDIDYVEKRFIEPFNKRTQISYNSQTLFQLICLKNWLEKYT